ncbi:MAG TPA: SPOR domain-containing protein [Candidatus Omnitrophota bacterium]|nr:SPOR domain-containing protein [Candidatus Omnitrophota bacterium]
MDINYKQDQFELFSNADRKSSSESAVSRFILSNVTLSAENIIVLTVFIFLAIIVSFSVGVEKGKRVASAQPVAVARKIAVQPVVADQPVEKRKAIQPQIPAASVADVRETASAPEDKMPQALVEAPQNFYTIQLASFVSKKYAEKEAAALEKKGYETFVVSKGKHIIVCVGRFVDSQAAKTFLGKLKDKYKDCLVRRL